MRSNVPQQGIVHFVEAIAIQVNIQVIRNIYIRVTQQAGENLHVHPLVIAQCLIGQPFSTAIREKPIARSALKLAFQDVYRLGREWDGAP